MVLFSWADPDKANYVQRLMQHAFSASECIKQRGETMDQETFGRKKKTSKK